MKNHPNYETAKRGEYLTHADRAKLIRSALALAFPSTKFSVTTKTYSGGGSVSVGWMDGPSSEQVEKIAGQFETRGFDGMIDMAHNCDLWLAPDGTASIAHDSGTQGSMGMHPEIIGSAHHPDAILVENICSGFVSCSHHFSADRLRAAIESVKAENWADLQSFNWDQIEVLTSEYDGSGYTKGAGSARVYNQWLDGFIFNRAAELGQTVNA